MNEPIQGVQRDRLRALPSVDEVLAWEGMKDLERSYPRWAVVECVRRALEERRGRILRGQDIEGVEAKDLLQEVRGALEARIDRTLRRVINATGIILHTNLGRALLAPRAMERAWEVALHYSSLEYDVREGRRGDRQIHIQSLFRDLTGAEAALAVNNNAAALLLILNTLAEGKEVICSRGELVEIGGSFRLPEIMKRGGAFLREVGTTNKTYLSDYEEAIGAQTALLLKVHASNYRLLGFTASPSLGELVELGRRHRLMVVEDLGSGAMVDLSPYGLPKEPLAQESMREGVDLVCFSGDKLLGGPQAGLILGKGDHVRRLARNPLARAMRLDKLSLACLEETLRIYWEGGDATKKIPVLSALTLSPEVLFDRARRLVEAMSPIAREAFGPQIAEGAAEAGGGSLPGISLPTWWVTLRPHTLAVQSLEARLRRGDPPILGRIHKGSLVLDMRTLSEEELGMIGVRLSELASEA